MRTTERCTGPPRLLRGPRPERGVQEAEKALEKPLETLLTSLWGHGEYGTIDTDTDHPIPT